MKAKAKPVKTRVANTKLQPKTTSSEKIKTTRTRTIPAGEFKAKCLAIIDEVHNRRERVIITKYGKPMAQLQPVNEAAEKAESIFGFMRGKIHILGDIVEPITDPKDSETEIFPPGTTETSR
jgi:prevent-host-death family protein